MKKILSIMLVAIMICTFMAACGETPDVSNPDTSSDAPAATLKFGLGVSANYGSTTDADGETNGAGEFNTTGVAVLLDAEGKIVKIDVDTAQIKTAWTSEGKVIATEELRTKYEKGMDYNMAAFGKKHDGSEGKPLEWFEQADAFMATVTGKTLDEAKAYMGSDEYAIGDMATAGCTIKVGEFMNALEKAVANAKDSAATAADSLNVALVSANSHSSKDASDEADGLAQIDTTIVAIVVNAEGKVVVADTDCTQGKMSFNAAGASTLDTTTAVKTKLEQGYDYNMAAFGKKHDGSEGKPLEWFEQAAEFNKALVGKTAADFSALMGEDTYAIGDLATAGCTMAVGDMVAAAVKAATVA